MSNKNNRVRTMNGFPILNTKMMKLN